MSVLGRRFLVPPVVHECGRNVPGSPLLGLQRMLNPSEAELVLIVSLIRGLHYVRHFIFNRFRETCFGRRNKWLKIQCKLICNYINLQTNSLL